MKAKLANFLGIITLAMMISACAQNSVYLGGSGAYSDYEDSKYLGGGSFLGGFFSSIFGTSQSQDYYDAKSGKRVGLANDTMRDSEAIQRATMKPYQIAGKWYYPQMVKMGEMSDGIASWYGPDFHAKKTSNGETYNMYAHTAAHKTLPMNTVVRVLNVENGRTTIVRINDRGPFVEGRIIDLSNVAAHDIDMVKKGTARVRLEVIGFGGVVAQEYKDALAATNAQKPVATPVTGSAVASTASSGGAGGAAGVNAGGAGVNAGGATKGASYNAGADSSVVSSDSSVAGSGAISSIAGADSSGGANGANSGANLGATGVVGVTAPSIAAISANAQSKDSTESASEDPNEFVTNNIENMEVVDSSVESLSDFNAQNEAQNAAVESTPNTEPVKVEIPVGASPSIVAGGQFAIQVGAFKNKSGAEATAKKYENLGENYSAKIKEFDYEEGKIYRVFIAGFKAENEASDFIKSRSIESHIIVRDE